LSGLLISGSGVRVPGGAPPPDLGQPRFCPVTPAPVSPHFAPRTCSLLARLSRSCRRPARQPPQRPSIAPAGRHTAHPASSRAPHGPLARSSQPPVANQTSSRTSPGQEAVPRDQRQKSACGAAEYLDPRSWPVTDDYVYIGNGSGGHRWWRRMDHACGPLARCVRAGALVLAPAGSGQRRGVHKGSVEGNYR
jgi:hypothetical protein